MDNLTLPLTVRKATAFMSKQRKRIANVRFTTKFSNYLLMAVLQASLAVCRGINMMDNDCLNKINIIKEKLEQADAVGVSKSLCKPPN